ncbi:Uncharacterised protein [Vibrio cholerae]|nr:Uncharacterised protein [Vibrio cholerae]CSI81400.1 Uncharacterised protein [Vibrio cholerae]
MLCQYCNAILRLTSTATEPESARNTCCKLLGASLSSFWQSSIAG